MSLPFYLSDPGPHWYDGRVPWVCLDLETTNKDRGDPRNPYNRIVAVCRNGRVGGDELISDLGDCEPFVLVAHNAKFELGWLLRYGHDFRNILPWDTMLAEYVLAGNRGWNLSLDATVRRYGLPGKDPAIDAMMKAGICPSQMPENWLRARVLYDVETTQLLANLQYQALKARGLLPVFFTRCIVTPVLAVIEANGMRLDRERVEREYFLQTATARAAQVALDQTTHGINMRSRPQLAAFLYDTLGFEELRDHRGEPLRTPSGLRLTDADTFERLKPKTDAQRTFLEAQKIFATSDARLSKYLQFFDGACKQQDGLILGQFNQAVTRSHRLSASAKRIETIYGTRGAQFQNMPRDYKRLFRAHEDGRVLAELDYAQLEFRAAVELAHDAQGLKDILDGHDVHTFTASVLKRKPMDKVTKAERQDAKPFTFKPLYGGQSGTPREQAYYAEFRKRYPEVNAMQQAWLAEVLRTKQLQTASGLVYYWEDTQVQRSGYVTNTPSIFNYPVQAFATADIVPIGVVHLYWRLTDTDVLMVNTIHDSVLLDCPADVEDVLKDRAHTALIEDVKNYVARVYGRTLWVPLAVEYTIAPHWADKDELVGSGTF